MRVSVARSAQVYCAGLALYLLAVRPPLLRWGASDDEVRRKHPGDRAVPDPHTVSTRAVAIGAQPDQIWPWLAQMGAGRGGLYSYDWLDRLFGYTGSPSSDDSSHLQPYKDTVMVIGIAHLQPIVALVAGILILVMPRLLNFIVAIYLILVGVMGLGLIQYGRNPGLRRRRWRCF